MKMTSTLSLALLAFCLGSVAAETPTPCCVPKQFIITIDEITNTVDNGSVISVQKEVKRAYDADNQLVSDISTEYNEETGKFEEVKVIELYPQGTKYVIRNGKCTKEALTHQFAELCVPPGATFDKTLTIALGHFTVNRFVLAVPQQGYDMEFRFSFDEENCIPYQYTAQKIASDGKMVAPSSGRGGRMQPLIPFFDVAGVAAEMPLGKYAEYTDYIEGIADPAFWFKPPAECQQPTKQQEVDAKKMKDRLRALFGNAPEFGGMRL